MRVLWIAAVVVLVDQVAKITVLQTMYRGQSIALVGDWLRLTFTENPGMAFGITFGPPGMVTFFSIIATFLIILYLIRVRGGYTPYRTSLALILGGALGNIIDRVFYAMLFGNGSFFQGHVVDFIHVNLWRGYVPDAIPFIGGHYLALFPIWNVADMAIVLGVVGILVFQKAFHAQLLEQEEASEMENPDLAASNGQVFATKPDEAASVWAPPAAREMTEPEAAEPAKPDQTAPPPSEQRDSATKPGPGPATE